MILCFLSLYLTSLYQHEDRLPVVIITTEKATHQLALLALTVDPGRGEERRDDRKFLQRPASGGSKRAWRE